MKFSLSVTLATVIQQPHSCWTDLHHSLITAKHLICITGWSVWDKLQLLRGSAQCQDNRTLGEILVDKAKQSVSGMNTLFKQF